MKKKWKSSTRENLERLLFERKKARRTARKCRRKRLETKAGKYVLVEAPVNLDLYSQAHRKMTLAFIWQIKRLSYDLRKHVILRFDRTEHASAAAVLLLYGTIDSIMLRTGKRCIRVEYPPHNKIEQILQHVGILRLLGKQNRLQKYDDDVGYWNINSGLVFSANEIGTFVAEILHVMRNDSVLNTRKSYTMLQETIANSLEHAYIDRSGEKLPVRNYHKYWAFAGVRDGRSVLLVLDLGVGIPMSIRAEHSPTNIQRVARALRIDRLTADHDYIKISTKIKRTRRSPGEGRGNGLSALTKQVEEMQGAMLRIWSNKGLYSINGVQSTQKLVKSINGTLIEFSFELSNQLQLALEETS